MVVAVCISLLAVGCVSSLSQQRPLTYTKNVDQELDLADQVAVSGSFHDNPLRLVGYALYPVGVMLEYIVTRPAYFVASLAPHVSGYTVEDAIFVEDPQPLRASR